jgi:hypothetical protein
MRPTVRDDALEVRRVRHEVLRRFLRRRGQVDRMERDGVRDQLCQFVLKPGILRQRRASRRSLL